MEIKHRPTMLIIMDGFGINPSDYGNAIKKAKKPNLDEIFKKYPHIKLNASGAPVGLPDGQMGNSEVGHLNIGAGRIIYQDLTEITHAIEVGEFFENKALLGAIQHVQRNNSTLHIMGLLSDGGVHSHIDHMKALVDLAKKNNIKKLYVHGFTDGRDTDPKSGLGYITEMNGYLEKTGLGKIGVVAGRYYAMDRDKRWDRIAKAYDEMTKPSNFYDSAENILEQSYKNNLTDEFVVPASVKGFEGVKDNDAIIFANFRPDRARQITRAFVDEDFDNYGFKREVVIKNINFVTMTVYDVTIPNVEVAFPPKDIKNTLGEYVSKLGLKQLRIAETEKYAHVTFFFNGGVEAPNPGEDRILVPSPKVATYDLKPEMSAYEVTDKVVEQIDQKKYDLIILNFANSDMVGHTGVFDAAVKAVETLDVCVKKIVDHVLKADGEILLTADHGNSDVMLTPEGKPFTAHSTNPVPLCYIANKPGKFIKEEGKLADIAPTLLTMMGLDVPKEMTGEVLIEK